MIPVIDLNSSYANQHINDYFKSTKHRVVNSHIHKTRFSMPHFVDPTPGTIVDNLRFHEASKYPPIESKEYLMWRLAQSY
tara:strand:+ start:3682 stop:3921 length:240 start_codon:yes stop_codon:yes gene_type:complete